MNCIGRKIGKWITLALICVASMHGGWGQSAVHAQSGEKMEFEVASIHEDRSDDKPRSNFSLDNGNVFFTVGKQDVFIPVGGTFSATGQTLITYINFAYNLTGTQFLSLRFKQYVGGSGNVPGWMDQKRFSIEAKAPVNATKDQMRAMLRSLLEDRFHLAVRWETRQVPVLGLVLAQPDRLGSRLRRHPGGDVCADMEADPGDGLPRVCGVLALLPPTGPGRSHFGGRNVSLALLAGSFPTHTGIANLRHPVIDETGLTGTFDFDMEWLPETPGGEAPPADATGPTFQKALKEQLGLKMVPSKGPVEVPVIDHVELPTAN